MGDNIGQRIYNLAESIFPICRSITGDGVRKTLQILDDYVSTETGRHFNIHEIPSGTKVFDWTVPKEWEIRDAYIENEQGEHIIDMNDNNLHVLGYSFPIDKWVGLEELKELVFTQPDQPDLIPYVTSYYNKRSGFCMSEYQLQSLTEGQYHVYIDSELTDGSLTYADYIVHGKTSQEVMITSYTCHPSMANNECSGPALLSELIRYVEALPNRNLSYRFILNPETIGSIIYLSNNYKELKKRIIAGVVLSCVGDDRDFSIIHTRYADTLADKSLENILNFCKSYTSYSFLERGSDERQYNAPGIDLPVVGFCRTKYGEYREYHTSADNMCLISPAGFQGSYDVMTQWIDGLENNAKYTLSVLCEPQLGKRGLYPTISKKGIYDEIRALTDFIGYADGSNDLFDISNYIGIPVRELITVVNKLKDNDLIR